MFSNYTDGQTRKSFIIWQVDSAVKSNWKNQFNKMHKVLIFNRVRFAIIRDN
jgi:hypothetical protein